ncbi:MAG: glutaminyl-tRNA synthase (glutamine-hydrolyzing) subunit A [Candidatus Sungbacteria bacterium RIFCSPLOWO2_02_FULL_51_17]|nr:MAG: glutaminyl-tRNA synthase (glutamine-hydrolyzing) subunit A [Candidatus Sungbacteria bacterium RIFCSPLOWO2_02_FULL_51_17]
MELRDLTIRTIAEGMRKKTFSAEEVVSAYCATIRRKDAGLHCYLEVFEEYALNEARRLDGSVDAFSDLPPLWGAPIAIKDNMLLEGMHASSASKVLEPYVASYDATAVSRLKKAGAIIIGRTNMDEFAMGSSTENSVCGPTKNPHDPARVPGGSSGGSAAAVAADLAVAALGSDTGGSIRQPASFCGVVGLKPTYGAVSRFGLMAMASSLDQIGPLAKNVDDARLLFDAIKGGDEYDATAVADAPRPDVAGERLRIGLPREYFGAGLDDDIKAVVMGAVKKLELLGHSVKEISLPMSEYALATYYIIMPAEVSANLARYDGIRYGHSAQNAETLFDVYAKSRAEGFGAETKRRVMLGTYILSHGYYDAYYLKAQKVRRRIQDDFRRAFEGVDCIVGPTSPTPAFAFGERTADPLKMYLADIYTVAVNLAGLPALSQNAGFVERGDSRLPVGIQTIAPWFGEERIFSIAGQLERELI